MNVPINHFATIPIYQALQWVYSVYGWSGFNRPSVVSIPFILGIHLLNRLINRNNWVSYEWDFRIWCCRVNYVKLTALETLSPWICFIILLILILFCILLILGIIIYKHLFIITMRKYLSYNYSSNIINLDIS